ncbi:Cation-dependent mannose-6-phosphate receptor [Bulinus truncatus]|nr:Cation-dependent mannose-6-phosphate receptor [Bulinus truncatus]
MKIRNVDISYSLLFYVLVWVSIFSESLTQTVPSVGQNAKIDDCSFKSYSDINALKDERERIKGLSGKSFSATKDGYKYTVGICKENAFDTSKNAAVIQQKLKPNSIEEDLDSPSHSLGNLSNTHMVLGTDWILLEYRGGETYGSHCNNEQRRSLIMITCDETKDDYNTQLQFLEEEKSKSEQCFYLFELKHKSVCPVYSDGSNLSVGSILVIVFFTVLAVYILVGFLYSRFVLQHKGIEQFPNYEFWKDFGNLQADGCNLVCRSKDRRRIDGIGGLGDDQLDPVEEIRDDNLLPM